MFLGLLKEFWPEIAMAIVAALVLAYIGVLKLEVSHYKGKYKADEIVISDYKAKEQVLKEDNARITAAHATTLARYKAEILANVKTTKEKIAANEELKNTRVSLDAVRLFNESKRSPEDIAESQPGNDVLSAALTNVSARLVDLFEIGAENDANHLTCIKQVKEWQGFWQEYSAAVKAVNGG